MEENVYEFKLGGWPWKKLVWSRFTHQRQKCVLPNNTLLMLLEFFFFYLFTFPAWEDIEQQELSDFRCKYEHCTKVWQLVTLLLNKSFIIEFLNTA